MAERRLRLSALLLLATLPAGCALAPQPGPVEPAAGDEAVREREIATRRASPAAATLIEQSRRMQETGQSAQAAATLERALRIEPNDPTVWLELARLRYKQADWSQAEQFARRAQSLAGADTALAGEAVDLIADCLVMQGRPAEAEALRQQR